MYCTKGVRGQTVPMVPEFKRYKGCQGIKGAKGAWVKSSEGLLGGRVFSRTHLRSSLTPEEGPSCSNLNFAIDQNCQKDISCHCSQWKRMDHKESEPFLFWRGHKNVSFKVGIRSNGCFYHE